ncbi:MAG: hypothetical protein R3F60_22020 [bacterium]
MRFANLMVLLGFLLVGGPAAADGRVDARLDVGPDGTLRVDLVLDRAEATALLTLDPEAPDAALQAALAEGLVPALGRWLRISADPTPCLWQAATWQAQDAGRYAITATAACPPAAAYDLDWGGRGATLAVRVAFSGRSVDDLALAPGDAPARLVRPPPASGSGLLIPAGIAAAVGLLGFAWWRRRR